MARLGCCGTRMYLAGLYTFENFQSVTSWAWSQAIALCLRKFARFTWDGELFSFRWSPSTLQIASTGIHCLSQWSRTSWRFFVVHSFDFLRQFESLFKLFFNIVKLYCPLIRCDWLGSWEILHWKSIFLRKLSERKNKRTYWPVHDKIEIVTVSFWAARKFLGHGTLYDLEIRNSSRIEYL